MHGEKLPGQRLMARDFDRQVAEIQVRIAVLKAVSQPVLWEAARLALPRRLRARPLTTRAGTLPK
jgi:hypothetical protein